MRTYQEFAIDYFQDEDGVFTARVPAIKGCIAWGESLEEAYHNAVDAIKSCLEAREKVSALKLRKPRYAGLNIYSRAVSPPTPPLPLGEVLAAMGNRHKKSVGPGAPRVA